MDDERGNDESDGVPMQVFDQRDQRTPTVSIRPAIDRSIEASLRRGAELRERTLRGELAAGPTPEHIARGLSAFLDLLGSLFVDLGEHEAHRAERWKRIAGVCDEAGVSALRCTIRTCAPPLTLESREPTNEPTSRPTNRRR